MNDLQDLLNNAPKPGDRVRVVDGPHQGRVGRVKKIEVYIWGQVVYDDGTEGSPSLKFLRRAK